MIPSEILIEDRYFIKEQIGEGGFGVVYLATDMRLKRQVVIKLLSPRFLGNHINLQMFEKEAEILASLDHHAVVKIYDYGKFANKPYLAMQLMRGGSLLDILEKEKENFTLNEVIKLLERIAPALDAIHAKNIIHRDLKPANILYDEYNLPYIADFGISGVEKSTSRHGNSNAVGFLTPRYSSPEQFENKKLNRRSDIYSLGIILYQLLSGNTPFNALTREEMYLEHKYKEIPNICEEVKGLPEEISRVFNKILAKDHNQRYNSANEVLIELKKIYAKNPKIPDSISINQPIIDPPRANRLKFDFTKVFRHLNKTSIVSIAMVLTFAVLLTAIAVNPSIISGSSKTLRIKQIDLGIVSSPTPLPVLPTQKPTSTPISTISNSPTLTQVTIAATSTPLIPSPSPSPTSSIVPNVNITPPRTRAPTPTLRPPTLPPPIILTSPSNADAFAVGQLIEFRWDGGGIPEGTQYFDVRVWQEGALHTGVVRGQNGVAFWTPIQTGTFYWSVAVVDQGGGETVVSEATPRWFTVHSQNE